VRLELRGITKRFGSLVANDSIDLVVEPGEIHCLLGENGAGKSTLMNVLYGLHTPDDGELLLDDRAVTFDGPGEAMAAGIGMVHQHFMLVPVFTVAESVVLGHERTRGPLLDLDAARAQVREISDRYGFGVDPDARIEDLPVGVQQRVEIIKALVGDARVLILDEPTAVLTPQETDELIDIMRQLKAGGTSVVFITHKLREVRAVADRITVIRRGRVVGTATPDASESELASLMVGRSVSLGVGKEPPRRGEEHLVVADLVVRDARGARAVDGVCLSVARGEVLAVAGVDGNGQSELAEAVLGLVPAESGSVRLGGAELLGLGVRGVLDAGVGFVPEDRSSDGVVATMSVAENLVLDLVRSPEYRRGLSLRRDAVRANAERRVQEFDVRTTSVDAPVGTLSGGNQQKVVLARELSRPLELFVASQPTRGLDVGSIEFVHRRIVAERDAGTPVVIVSTELDEVVELADRIAVMYRGRVVGVVEGDTDRDVLGLMMAGVPEDEARRQATSHPTRTDHLDDQGGRPTAVPTSAPPPASGRPPAEETP